MFDAPAGILRVGTERDHFLRKVFPTLDKRSDSTDAFWFLVIPLPVMCICYILFTLKGKSKPKFKFKLGAHPGISPDKIQVGETTQQVKALKAPTHGVHGVDGAELRTLRNAMKEEEEGVMRDLESTKDWLHVEDLGDSKNLGSSIKNFPSLRDLPSTNYTAREAWALPTPLAIEAPNRESITENDRQYRKSIMGNDLTRNSIRGSLPALTGEDGGTDIVAVGSPQPPVAQTTLRHPQPPADAEGIVQPSPLSASAHSRELRLLRVIDL
jgi:hypothetical protein